MIPASPSKLPKWLRPLFRWSTWGYILFLIGVVGGMGEIAARIIFPNYAKDVLYENEILTRVAGSPAYFEDDFIYQHPQFGTRMHANFSKTKINSDFDFSFRTNSLGFRAHEVSEVDSQATRLLLLGDSMLFGWGENEGETVADQLEQQNSSLQVFNYCIPGTHTQHARTVASEQLDSLKPDHLIYGLFLGNDLLPNVWSSIDGKGNFQVTHSGRTQLWEAIQDQFSWTWHSVLFRVLAVKGPHIRMRYRLSSQPEILSHTMEALEALKTLCEARNIRFSVVLIPPAQTASSSLFNALSGIRSLRASLSAAAQKSNIEVWDLTPELQERGAESYFPVDKHLSPAGCQVVAAAIGEHFVNSPIHETH